jgi:hypothetical protein
MSALSSSLQRLSLRLLALQLLGNAGLLLAAALWLEIPDSHLWELLLSLLGGAAIVVGALLLQATVIRRLRGAKDGCPLWIGSLLLAVWAFLLYVPSILVDLFSPASYERASYWNSQLSPHMRATFTYERLVRLQFFTFDFVVWFLVPALLLPYIIETVARGVRGNAWRAGLRVLGQLRYWAICLAVAVIVHWLVLPIIGWQPGHSVAAEIVSVVLRVGIVYVAIVLLLTLLAAVTATWLARRDALGNTVMQPAEDNSKSTLLNE